MKSLALFAIVVGLFVAPAFASGNPADSDQQTAPAASAEAPAPVNTTPAPMQCQPVKFTRPDVQPGKDHFMIVLRKGDLQTIQACNPDSKVHQIPAGIGVVITYGPAGATINLPPTLKDDVASNGRCVVDGTGNLVDQVEYTGPWSEGLPDHVELKKLDPAYYDKPAQLAICKQVMEAHKYNQ